MSPTTTTTTLYLILFLVLQMIFFLKLFQIHQDLYAVSGTVILYKKPFFYITDNGNCTYSRVYIRPIQTEVKFVNHLVAWIHTSVLS